MNRTISLKTLAWFLTVLLATLPTILAQQAEQTVFKQEELDQILAPIALHPDPLVSQILMASTYPLEVVQADRWAKQNAKLKGDALTAALEKQDWDASVKSLVNFPQVLTMMSEKLDWTQKLGDAFLADQKVVLDTIQKLRAKAQESGNLKTTQEQTVIVEEKIIKIEPANPQVIYVPSYNPTVVYGAWPYPAYPPYYYYPPGYVATSMFAFGAGVAMGAAWGYAWGNSNWGGGNVDVDVNRNFNSNRNIDRSKYQGGDRGQGGRFQHNPEHRKGVSYRDQGTSQKFNRASTNDAIKSREQFRGRAEQGGQESGRGGAGDRAGGGERADARKREDRISGAEAQAIAPASAIAAVKVGRVTAAEQETVAAVAAASVVVREVAAVLSAVSIGAAAQRAAPAHAAVPAEEAPAAVAPGAVEVAAEDEVEEAAAGAAGKKV